MADFFQRNKNALIEFMNLYKEKFDSFAIPLNQINEFDVIGIKGEELLRIRIVVTETKNPSGAYVANLCKSGGYYQKKERKNEPFSPSSCDLIFICTPNGKYLIPSKDVKQTKAITLSVFKNHLIPS